MDMTSVLVAQLDCRQQHGTHIHNTHFLVGPVGKLGVGDPPASAEDLRWSNYYDR